MYDFEEVDWNDEVFCVETTTGIILVRKNGKATWVGNCCNNLVYVLNGDSKLVDVSLKDFYPLAENRKLTNIFDAGVLFDQKKKTPYFTEFCSSRKGWASFVTELSMLPSASYFFECVKDRITPKFEKEYGFAIVLYNQDNKEDLSIVEKGDDKNLWTMYYYKDEEGNRMTTGGYEAFA